jgi:hypothetical protein
MYITYIVPLPTCMYVCIHFSEHLRNELGTQTTSFVSLYATKILPLPVSGVLGFSYKK